MTPGISALQASTARLEPTLAALDDAAAWGPSALPGWNRAMVLTHLARNADAFRRVIEGGTGGEPEPMYPHGPEGRDADIEAGRERSAAAVALDVRDSATRLAAALEALTAEGWARRGLAFRGAFPLREIPARRRREVEVHHIDLALAYGPGDWPADFVEEELALAVGDLPQRLPDAPDGSGLRVVASDDPGGQVWEIGDQGAWREVRGPRHQLLAWLLGRASELVDPPRLAPWR